MNNKGFTLIELLAVIIILAMLTLIVSSSVTKIVSDSRKDLYNTQINLIKAAAESWGADNIYKLPNSGTCSYITLLDLKEYGLLDSSIINPKTKKEFSDDMKIKITTKLSKYNTQVVNYEVASDDVNSCTYVYDVANNIVNPDEENNDVVCMAVTESSLGNVPSKNGTFALGDEYVCTVGMNESNNFYVLGIENDRVNLIMDSNIAYNGSPIKSSESENKGLVSWYSTDDNSQGPVVAMDYLYNATKEWDYVSDIIIDYKDNLYGGIKTENGKTSIKSISGNIVKSYDNLKARLPEISELRNAGCNSSSGCPAWLSNYTEEHEYKAIDGFVNVVGVLGYWTSSTMDSTISNAWYTHYTSSILSETNVSDSSKYGVRPVISVEKNRITN